MNLSVVFMLVFIVLLICGSAFFSASETAYLSIPKLRLRQMQKDASPKIRRIASLKQDMDRLLTTILIGNNFVNNLASSAATALAVSLAGEKGAGFAAVIMTVLIITFGEVLPKTVAIYQVEKIAEMSARALSVLEILLAPVVKLFTMLTRLVGYLVDKIWKNETPLVTEEELKTLIEVGSQEGTLEAGETDMLYKIFEFGDLRVRDIVRHRSLVQAISADADYAETVRFFSRTGYSRLPVYDGEPNNYIGVVHYKDVLFCKKRGGNISLGKGFIAACMHRALFVPETQSALSLLYTFRQAKANFAVVVDEHGTNSGIVTMADILNAVFGRITDEYSTGEFEPEARIQILSATEFRVPGELKLSDVNSIFSLNCESADFDTFGGWLLEQFGYLPSSGEVLRRGKYVFVVEDQAQRRIKTIRLSAGRETSASGENRLGVKAPFRD